MIRHCSVCGQAGHDRRRHQRQNPRNPGATARLRRKLDGADNREWHRKFAPAIRRRKAAGSPGYYAARHARRHGRG